MRRMAARNRISTPVSRRIAGITSWTSVSIRSDSYFLTSVVSEISA